MTANKHTISLKKWLLHIFVILMLVLLVVMLTVSGYAGMVMREQVFTANESILALYMEKLDTNLLNMEKFIINFPASNDDLSQIMVSSNEKDEYLAIIGIYNDLNKNVMVYDTFDGIFVYSQRPQEDIFINVAGAHAKHRHQQDIRDYVTAYRGKSEGWEHYTVDGCNYMIRMVRTGSVYCGAWIDMENLMLPLKNIDLGDHGFAMFVDTAGTPLTAAGAALLSNGTLSVSSNNATVRLGGQAFLQNSLQSQYADLSLVTLIPDQLVLKTVHTMQLVILLAFVVIFCVIPVIGFSINKRLYRPVQELANAMELVGQGRLDTRVPTDSRFSEFTIASNQFNRMVAQIKQLTEDVYERELRAQKIQLQYLQLQIRPHFFLNTLNVIYSFAQIKRYDLIQQLTLCLVKYFRYMFNNAGSFVTLREEKEHVENYMRIQELRFPGVCRFLQSIDDQLLEYKLPPLIIQTFIENSVKYALDVEKERVVSLTVTRQNCDNGEYVKIEVADNGDGYPQSILDAFQKEQAFSSDPTKNIGIINVVQRLKLMYGHKAFVRLCNSPEGGAKSEVLLPLCPPGQEEQPCIPS
ncbi:MAG: histidine kinase [Angelakisella sp.]